jgi:phosphoglycerate dehydrogenase-like enzyme
MSDERPLVWLPFGTEKLGEAPEGLRYETVVLDGDEVPDSVDQVQFYVPGYQVGAGQGRYLARMPRLRVVQTLTAGVDHIREEVPEGVQLCNGRGIHNASTAELALTLTLASLRDVPGFTRDQDAGRWNQGWRTSLADKTVLIVGYGDIGRDIESRLVPFEVDVLRVARTARDGVHALADLPDLLPRCDVVVLVLPGTSETRGLVDTAFLGRMKDDALLVNVGRGTVVDEEALLEALGNGQVSYACLDVFAVEPLPQDSPLWTHPRVMVSPHTSALSAAENRLIAERFCSNLRTYLDGGELPHLVDTVHFY